MNRKILVCLLLGAGLLGGCGNRRARDISSQADSTSVSLSRIEIGSGVDEDGMRFQEKPLPDEDGEPGSVYVGTINNKGPIIIKVSDPADESVQLLIGEAGVKAEEAFREGVIFHS